MDFMTPVLISDYKICDGKGSIAHRVPCILVMIDDTKAMLTNARDFFGKPLHTV